MSKITVSSKEELERAVKKHYDEIIVENPELAEQVKLAYKIKTYGPATIAIISGALATAPLTGGLSILAVNGILVASGVSLSTSVILALIALAAIIFIMINEYCIEVEGDIENGKGKLVLKKC